MTDFGKSGVIRRPFGRILLRKALSQADLDSYLCSGVLFFLGRSFPRSKEGKNTGRDSETALD